MQRGTLEVDEGQVLLLWVRLEINIDELDADIDTDDDTGDDDDFPDDLDFPGQ